MQRMDQDANYTKEVYLTTASNSLEAESLETLLTANDIPVLKKFREAGAYLEIYMGTSNFGVDIYVPSDLLEKARDIIGDISDAAAEVIQQNPEENIEEEQSNYKRKQRALSWLIILILLPGVLWIAVILFLQLYRWFTA